jgi:hypothetical protein
VAAVAHDLATHLALMGHGTLGETVFAGRLPPTPDAAVAVQGPYGGEGPIWTHDGMTADRQRVQIAVRAATYAAAESLATAIYRTLAKVVNGAMGEGHYQRVMPLQAPFLLERDEHERVIFAFNCAVTRNL